MAARMKAADLREIIRLIVREEMRNTIAEVINEVMTERYLKKVVAEAVALAPARPAAPARARVGKLTEVTNLDGDEDEEATPEVLDNDDDGVYHQHPMKKEGRIDRDAILSAFFEGTRPLKKIEESAPAVPGTMDDSGIPIRALAQDPADVEKWKKLALAPAAPKGPVTINDEKLLEKRLAEKRKALEVPAKT